MSDRVILALVVVFGVPAVLVGYLSLIEWLLRGVSDHRRGRVRPWLWLLPGLAFLGVYLVYPSLKTIYLSFLNANSTKFVGLDNYRYIFTDHTNLISLRNNVLWVIFFTGAVVAFGLIIAVLTDRVRYESIARGVVFLPMAVSFVAAGVIWRFMYDYRPPGLPQTGTLNAALNAVVPGYTPHAWLIQRPLNTFAIIGASVWMWTGFAAVILAAALKGVPADVLEAARVDGASEWHVFWRIIFPLLGTTIAVVTTTVVIIALKAFDIVYVMTNGNYDTDVIANRMYKEMFNFNNFGRASAIAVVLLCAIVPVMLYNLRSFRSQEATR
ncbi:MAG TPA: sugar ABC transporter permease [Dehalococcoidia bacterium]|nr:sugar ABC transporter permease [Dehalococcoidia bacterium]